MLTHPGGADHAVALMRTLDAAAAASPDSPRPRAARDAEAEAALRCPAGLGAAVEGRFAPSMPPLGTHGPILAFR